MNIKYLVYIALGLYLSTEVDAGESPDPWNPNVPIAPIQVVAGAGGAFVGLLVGTFFPIGAHWDLGSISPAFTIAGGACGGMLGVLAVGSGRAHKSYSIASGIGAGVGAAVGSIMSIFALRSLD